MLSLIFSCSSVKHEKALSISRYVVYVTPATAYGPKLELHDEALRIREGDETITRP